MQKKQFVLIWNRSTGRHICCIQCSVVFFSRNIGYVTLKIISFHYQKNIYSGSKYPTKSFWSRSTADALALCHSLAAMQIPRLWTTGKAASLSTDRQSPWLTSPPPCQLLQPCPLRSVCTVLEIYSLATWVPRSRSRTALASWWLSRTRRSTRPC